MTEAINQARTALAEIVDRMIAENPELVGQYNKVFAEGGGADWITYGLTQRADELDQLVQEVAAESGDSSDGEGFGLGDLFGDDEDEPVEDLSEEEFLEEEFECIGGGAVPA